ncbi:hypothetical protein ABTY00_05620 [Streptomyces microflavus]|uniref:hypothetical protein n=1 Tax=Streptomyces microflavus TaxID=1919 RepID=UPI0033312124
MVAPLRRGAGATVGRRLQGRPEVAGQGAVSAGDASGQPRGTAHADDCVGELADVRREQQAAASAAARAVAVSSSSSSNSEAIFATDPFVDFREDPEGDNCRASRNWAQHQVVQIVECAGQFKFAEHTPEPADAFPAATWSSFTVVELDVADCTTELAGGTLASAGSAP